MVKKISNVTLEGAELPTSMRNFSGLPGTYNAAGERSFNVFLDEELAQKMIDDGWNVKHLKPREEEDEPRAFLPVEVSFKVRPPRVVMITSRGRTPLKESELDILDWASFSNVDMIINPYFWNVNGKSGVKAYLQSLFVTIEEDYLEKKYANVPDSAVKCIGPDCPIEEDA